MLESHRCGRRNKKKNLKRADESLEDASLKKLNAHR